MATVDGPGIVYLNGLIGHTGVISCHLYCTVIGCHKEGGHYYPALLKLDNYNIEYCNHTNIDLTHFQHLDYRENLKMLMAICNDAKY